MVGIDGQQIPLSLALSASEIRTNFWVLGMSMGQQAAMISVLNPTAPSRRPLIAPRTRRHPVS
jgi:hypothetical protein